MEKKTLLCSNLHIDFDITSAQKVLPDFPTHIVAICVGFMNPSLNLEKKISTVVPAEGRFFPVRQSQNACGNHVPSRLDDPASGQSLNLRCLVSGYIGDLPGGMS